MKFTKLRKNVQKVPFFLGHKRRRMFAKNMFVTPSQSLLVTNSKFATLRYHFVTRVRDGQRIYMYIPPGQKNKSFLKVHFRNKKT